MSDRWDPRDEHDLIRAYEALARQYPDLDLATFHEMWKDAEELATLAMVAGIPPEDVI